MSFHRILDGPWRKIVPLVIIVAGWFLHSVQAASISEPSTVFYGKVTATGSAQPFLLTYGDLEWTIRTEDGEEVTLTGLLQPLNGDTFSYRLDVPHQALALGLPPAEDTVPLRQVEQTHAHLEIKIKGKPARIVGPGESRFHVAQALRAATYRLDLEVEIEAIDTDGDGLPDWWESKYGLDPQANDAHGDADGDGLSNLAEYLAGTDPTHDNRFPELMTTEIVAHDDLSNGVGLRTFDADSTEEDLTYTLVDSPSKGTLYLRFGGRGLPRADHPLRSGDRFTQRAVSQGRLLFAFGAKSSGDAVFRVQVRDENPDHPAAEGKITVLRYSPPSETLEERSMEEALSMVSSRVPLPSMNPESEMRFIAYLLGHEREHIVWDLVGNLEGVPVAAPTAHMTSIDYETRHLPEFGAERGQAMLGGRGKDRLQGGMAADFIVGGPGDDELFGGDAADVFCYYDQESGHDTLKDFTLGEDIIDLVRVFDGSSSLLDDYVLLNRSDDSVRLGVDANGDGSGFADMEITLEGLPGDADLGDLVDSGSLVTGLTLLPRVTLAATSLQASENGPSPAVFTLSRTGNLDQPLTVTLAFGGSAQNGVDYASLEPAITIPAGQSGLTLEVMPFADTQTEPEETVEIILAESEDYRPDGLAKIVVTIRDLQPLLVLETLEERAVRAGGLAGAVLIRRSGLLDRTVVARLEVSGTAREGVDYAPISKIVRLAAGQTTELIDLTPLSTPAGQAKTVHLELLPDPAYLLGDIDWAHVTLVDRLITLAEWRQATFGGDGDLAVFAGKENGGLSNLLRYAFGIAAAPAPVSRLPEVTVRDGHLSIDYWTRPEAADLDFVVEQSSDLRSWTPAGDRIERIFPVEHRSASDVVSYRFRATLNDGGDRFLRLRVIRKP